MGGKTGVCDESGLNPVPHSFLLDLPTALKAQVLKGSGACPRPASQCEIRAIRMMMGMGTPRKYNKIERMVSLQVGWKQGL